MQKSTKKSNSYLLVIASIFKQVQKSKLKTSFNYLITRHQKVWLLLTFLSYLLFIYLVTNTCKNILTQIQTKVAPRKKIIAIWFYSMNAMKKNRN